MIPRVPLREALSDPNLLGTAIAGDSWRSWRTLLIAGDGRRRSSEDEREIFTKLTGREREPLQRVDQFAAVVGRRGGKSRAMATLATYIAGSVRPLRCAGPGRARCLTLCRTRSASGEDHPRLRRGLLRTQSDPEAADREPNCGCVRTHQRDYPGGPPGKFSKTERPNVCCGARRRACLLVR